MAAGIVLAGTAAAVRAATAICPSRGVALIGDGAVEPPVLARAAAWSELDLGGVDGQDIVLAAPPADGAEARAILERAALARKRLHLLEARRVRRLRLDDLIGRPLGESLAAGELVRDRRVLITGGGGSIGAELARRITMLGPSRLALLDSSECNLFRIGLDLPEAVPILADVRDSAAVRRWFAREKPELVFHAAALKQVPLVEAFPSEGVLTNIGGLRHVAEACSAFGGDLIFVSTDKAADPSGAMGATKRLGELYCQALDRRGAQRAISVRLGNVLGSAGSVAPTFEAQLAAGGPLTVTHAEVTRFFVTIPQAAEAILRAAAAGLGALARGVVYTIDMGEALPVVELAREVIRLEGLRPEVDIPIVFTGLRPGEKLHELLIGADEWREPDPAPGVMAVTSRPRNLAHVQEAMERLCRQAKDSGAAGITRALFDAIAEQEQASAAAGTASSFLTANP